MIQLTKPLAFFDLETTGTSVTQDKIIQIAIVKLLPSGERIEKKVLMNPEMPIPEAATEINGIIDEMVANEPPFRKFAKSMHEFLQDSDLAGFNSNSFDVPLLAEEFLRCGIDFPNQNTKLIDVCNIFRKKEDRTLAAASKFYLGKEIEGAHDALNDAITTLDVFKTQITFYDDLPKDVAGLAEYSCAKKSVDWAGTIGLDEEGDYIYLIGKNKGIKLKKDMSFAQWMLKQDFSQNTKLWIRKIEAKLKAKK
jgi:DNA polymerase-3 subunit epsilon